MILICPFCQSRYLIAASLFAKGPRQVRCVRCSHQWKAEIEQDVVVREAVALADVSPPPRTLHPIPRGSNLPALVQKSMPLWLRRGLIIAGSVVLFLLLALLLGFRGNLVKQWPFLEGFYDRIGLHVAPLGEGLKIENVRSELYYEDGIMQLKVEGNIVNQTQKSQDIPPLMASAIGSDGDVMQSWQIELPAATVTSSGTIPFTSTIASPKGTVVEINLNFVEAQHASE